MSLIWKLNSWTTTPWAMAAVTRMASVAIAATSLFIR